MQGRDCAAAGERGVSNVSEASARLQGVQVALRMLLQSSPSLELMKNHAWKPLPVSNCENRSGFQSHFLLIFRLAGPCRGVYKTPCTLYRPALASDTLETSILSPAAVQSWVSLLSLSP